MPSIDQLSLIFTDILNFEEVERAQWFDRKSNAVIYKTNQRGGPGTEVLAAKADRGLRQGNPVHQDGPQGHPEEDDRG